MINITLYSLIDKIPDYNSCGVLFIKKNHLIHTIHAIIDYIWEKIDVDGNKEFVDYYSKDNKEEIITKGYRLNIFDSISGFELTNDNCYWVYSNDYDKVILK